MASSKSTGHFKMSLNPSRTSPGAPATMTAACVVRPLDRVTYTPHEPSGLAPIIKGTVFDVLDTHSGNRRVRIVREGEDFPFGLSVNVYSNLGTFETHGVLDTQVHPAVA